MDWWLTDKETAADIHFNLRMKEKDLPVFFGQSPQISSRRYLVDWLAIIAESYDLCYTARHLAILLLDYFMDKFDIEEPQLRIVALGCLLIACKFEEIETKIPKASRLNEKHASTCGYTLWHYLQMELSLLEFFSWKISFPTAAHYRDYFLQVSVINADLHANQPIIEISKTRNYVKKYVNYFLEISLQDPTYREFKPSLVCAACIASARHCLNISPTWSNQLSKCTWYNWQEIEPVIYKMLKTHERDTEQAGPRLSDSMSSISPCSNPSTGSAPPTPTSPQCIQEPMCQVFYNFVPQATFCGVISPLS